MVEVSLKPCPFCTMPALRVSCNRLIEDVKWWMVECQNCGTDGPHSTVSEAEAITAWNTRASEAHTLRVAEAVRDACAKDIDHSRGIGVSRDDCLKRGTADYLMKSIRALDVGRIAEGVGRG